MSKGPSLGQEESPHVEVIRSGQNKKWRRIRLSKLEVSHPNLNLHFDDEHLLTYTIYRSIVLDIF